MPYGKMMLIGRYLISETDMNKVIKDMKKNLSLGNDLIPEKWGNDQQIAEQRIEGEEQGAG
jgi:hypothetical protein